MLFLKVIGRNMLPHLPNNMRSHCQKNERGFTLVEAVVSMVIAGIIAGMVALFIRLPVQGYVDSTARADLTDVADTALRRMARDLRLALPNSLRRTTVAVGAQQIVYLEFLLTKTGGRYLAEEDNPSSGNILNFTDNTQLSFDVVGPMPTSSQAIVSGDFIVVYNLGPGMSPADAYDCTSACNRATVASAPVGNTITLTSNTFAAQPAPAFTSPGRYFQVVTTPVTYVCDPVAKTLTRYSGYTINASQPQDVTAVPLSTATDKALLASGVTACEFSYDNSAGSLASQRTGIVGLSLTMNSTDSGGNIRLFHQVHVDNTP